MTDSALTATVGLDSMLGARKDALLAGRRLTEAEITAAAAVIRRHARDAADCADLMGYVFGETRPLTPVGAGVPHPADCGCAACRHRRDHTTTKGETR